MEILKSGLKKNKSRRLALILLLLFGSLILGILLLNHYFIRCYGYDYSVYNFAFYDYAHFKVSPCTFYMFPYDITFLQDHFSLTLMFLSPLYWLMGGITGTYSLLIIQSIIVVMGGWASYQFILFKTGNNKLSIMTLIYYFILLGRYTASSADCNIAIIGSALVPIFLYYFEKEKVVPAAIFFILLVFNREDFSLWLIFICVFLMLTHRKDKLKLKWSIVFFISALVFFIVIFKFIIPALEDENKKYTLFNFAALGKTPSEALMFILSHPFKTFELLFSNHSGSNYYDGIKPEFYIVFLISGGFLLLFRPLYFIPFLPLIAKKMFNDDPIRWSFESYYWVEFVSLMPIMVFWIISNFKNEKLKPLIGILICVCTLVVTLFEITKPYENHIALLADTHKNNFLNKDFYHSEYDVKDIYATMALIPDTAYVSASGKLSTHLAMRKKIYNFPRIDEAQYIFLFKKNDNWPSTQGHIDTLVKDLIAEKTWEVLSDKKDIILLRKK